MADYTYINSTGVVVADTADILVEVQNEYKDAFGQDLVVTPDTPQGVLITSETLARSNVVNNNAALANQINPNISAGIFLDAIMALTGMQRTVATRTLVSDVSLTGVAGTVIPAGTQAKTTDGDIFYTTNNVVIGSGGTVTADFMSLEYGPIPCAANTLTDVNTAVLGWETVNNPTAGVLGANTQSDVGARAYRQNTLGFQGVALPVCMTSSLYAVEGVQSLWFQENIAATTETINGISMVPHSIYVCINGGTNLDIAAAILENKSNGCNWNGGVTVSVVEPASGQSYSVKFDRPTEKPILIKVTTTNGQEDDIKSAIMAYVNGDVDNMTGFIVGGDVSPFEIAGAISQQYPSTFISKVEISYDTPVSYTTDVLPIAVNEIATTSLVNITVVIA